MKKLITILLLILLYIFGSSLKIRNTNSSYCVLESTTNTVLESNNMDEQMLIASTAKILTAITVIENYDIEKYVIVEEKDTLEVGSKVYLKIGESIKIKDLLYALMLRSANDAASVLSNNNDLDFILLMNHTAKRIGMKNSVFLNASGLDELEYNLSTAYDMALLSAYASKNETFIEISSAHSHSCKTSHNNYYWINKHRLVKNNDNYLWGKTGYTKASSRVLVSNYKDNYKDIIIVTINDSNDWNTHIKFIDNLEYSFITIFNKGYYDLLGEDIFINKDLIIPIKKENKDDIKVLFMVLNEVLTIEVYVNEKVIYIEKMII